jgi:hypothetical protein
MNAEIWTEVAQILIWEYLFQIFGILSLQCMVVPTQFLESIFLPFYPSKNTGSVRQLALRVGGARWPLCQVCANAPHVSCLEGRPS